MGTPRTRSPWTFGGDEWLPTQTSGPRLQLLLQCGHEWIALFATLGLFDGVGVAFCVVPHIVRRGAIERPDERQASVCKDLKQAVQHAGAGDVVERPNPVNREDGLMVVQFSGSGQGFDDRFGASSGRESELAGASCLNLCGIKLGQGASN